MIKRIRDLTKRVRPVQNISQPVWEDIEKRALIAEQIKSSPAYDLLLENLNKAKDIVLENRVHEVQEHRTISKGLKKVFITPREEQLNELSGQIKFINLFMREIDQWINRKRDFEKMESEGSVTIER